MEESIQKTATTRAFARDLQSMLQEAETLVRNAGQQLRDDYRTARDRVASTVSTSLSDAKKSFNTVEDSVLTRARNTARTTNSFVVEHPWQAFAAGACIGFVLGVLSSRR